MPRRWSANKLVVDNRKAWEAKIERTAQQLNQLGVPRSAGVIQAEIDALRRKPGADDCKIINGPVTNEVCPKVDALRQELAVSQRAAEPETDLVVDRKRLQAVPVAASVVDPQSATLSRLTALGEAKIPDIIAIKIWSPCSSRLVALWASPSSCWRPGRLRRHVPRRWPRDPKTQPPEPERRPVKPGIPMKQSETPDYRHPLGILQVRCIEGRAN